MYTVYFDHILRPPILFGTPQPCPSPNFMSSFILTYQVKLVLPMTQKYESDSISQRSTKASLSLWFFCILVLQIKCEKCIDILVIYFHEETPRPQLL